MKTQQPKIPGVPKKCCLCCHFFTKESSGSGTKPIDWKTREEMAEDIATVKSLFKVLIGNYPLETWIRCWRGEWDWRRFRNGDEVEIEERLKQSCGRCSSFHRHKPNMGFEDAAILAQQDLARKRFKWTTIIYIAMLILAIVTIIVSVIAA